MTEEEHKEEIQKLREYLRLLSIIEVDSSHTSKCMLDIESEILDKIDRHISSLNNKNNNQLSEFDMKLKTAINFNLKKRK